MADLDSLVVDLNPVGLALVVDVGDWEGRHEGLAQEVRVLELLGSLLGKLGTYALYGNTAVEAHTKAILLNAFLHVVLDVGRAEP